MEKPIEIVIDETENKIAEILNSSGLPLICIQFILNDFLNQVIALQQKEIEKYNKENSGGSNGNV